MPAPSNWESSCKGVPTWQISVYVSTRTSMIRLSSARRLRSRYTSQTFRSLRRSRMRWSSITPYRCWLRKIRSCSSLVSSSGMLLLRCFRSNWTFAMGWSVLTPVVLAVWMIKRPVMVVMKLGSRISLIRLSMISMKITVMMTKRKKIRIIRLLIPWLMVVIAFKIKINQLKSWSMTMLDSQWLMSSRELKTRESIRWRS